MQIDPEKNLITGIEQQLSPNFSPRPDNTNIDLLVIHNISLPPQEYGGPWITDLFCNQLDPNQHPYFKEIAALKVSSHLLIQRDGNIIQYVPFNKAAWHAGASIFKDRERCNEFSIGVELEGSDFESFTENQYKQLVNVTNLLISHYPCIKQGNIIGHSDIAPGRKTDPGPYFEWSRFLQEIRW